MKRVFGITGWKNSGKTALMERLVRELVARGYRVSTVKHAHHGFETGREGADSLRHRAAGAHQSAVISATRWALNEAVQHGATSLVDILARLAPSDIILVEGFKREPHAKIELRRLGARDSTPIAGTVPNVVAIAADHPVADCNLPVFGLDDIAAIADFLEQVTGLKRPV